MRDAFKVYLQYQIKPIIEKRIRWIIVLLPFFLIVSCTHEGEIKREATHQFKYSADSSKVFVSSEVWKNILPPDVYGIAWRSETEAPYSSSLNSEKRKGEYRCFCCEWPLFSSEAKFDSGTGWPSFFEPIHPDHILLKADNKMTIERTEIRCSRCGAHLGHMFVDGPLPSGKRYCLNGKVLSFRLG